MLEDFKSVDRNGGGGVAEAVALPVLLGVELEFSLFPEVACAAFFSPGARHIILP
jgi:hypothetical protein